MAATAERQAEPERERVRDDTHREKLSARVQESASLKL